MIQSVNGFIEIYKDIKGYEGLYQVGNFGNVKRLGRVGNYHKNIKQKNLNKISDICGYLKVNLYKDGKSKMCFIHRLVAEAFISNPNNKNEINHIDGIKTNNNIRNLEWATKSENHKHAYKLGLMKPYWKGKKGIYNINSKKIKQKDNLGNIIRIRDSITIASNVLSIPISSISACLTLRNKTCRGYKWEYFI